MAWLPGEVDRAHLLAWGQREVVSERMALGLL